MALESATLLQNRYRIESVIARGGMGAIYLATDEILGVRIAVKENFFDNPEASRQFRIEATILANLRHPNLPRVTDHFTIPNQGQYLVMDYIEGEDLRQMLSKHGKLPTQEVLRIGAAICDALAYLHSRFPPIVHRDIKPGNIKITPSGQIYLVDFGLAKLVQAQNESTITGAQGMTPGYSPPEQYGRGTEPRSDIYALGATLYAAITGKVPEDGLSRLMGTGELTPVRQHNPAIPVQVAQVIEKAMSVEIEDRYSDCNAFRQALEGVRHLQPIITPPAGSELPTIVGNEDQASQKQPSTSADPTIREVNSPPVQAHTTNRPAPAKRFPVVPVVMGVVIVVLLVTAGILFFSQSQPPLAKNYATPTDLTTVIAAAATENRPTATLTLLPTLTATTQPTETLAPLLPTETSLPTDTPAPTETSAPAATPVGGSTGQIAYASSRGGAPQIWVMNVDGSDNHQVTSLPSGACQPDWSPDGTRLVFISPCKDKQDSYEGSSMYLIGVDGTGLKPLNSLPGGDFDPAWSPDGSQIAFTSVRNGLPNIYLYHLADNSVSRVSRPVNRERHPAWSSNGTRLAYETNRAGQPQIWTLDMTVADPSAAAREFSALEGGFEYMPAWSPDGSVIMYSQGSYPASYTLIARQVASNITEEFKVAADIMGVENPCYSPDGWWLVFSRTVEKNSDIYIMQPTGVNLTRLTDDPAQDFHPSWHP